LVVLSAIFQEFAVITLQKRILIPIVSCQMWED